MSKSERAAPSRPTSAAMFLLTIVLLLTAVTGLQRMFLVSRMKDIAFLYPNSESLQRAMNSGEYVPGNPVTLDVDVDHRGRLLHSMPNFYEGSPVTVGVYSHVNANGTGLFYPYPNWDWHARNDCLGMVSVFRIQVDRCRQLWVLDSGVTEVMTRYVQRCPPKLLVFSLDNDTLVRRHEVAVQNDALLVTIKVENNIDCTASYAYMADTVGRCIYVYSTQSDRSWSHCNELFEPDPMWTNFSVANTQFSLDDGVLGLALHPPLLFFHSLASVNEGVIHTRMLQNDSNSGNSSQNDFRLLPGRRSSQSAAEDIGTNALAESAILYFSLLSENSVNCWNLKTTFGTENFREIDRDDEVLQFASGVKVVRAPSGEDLYVLTCRYQLMAVGARNSSNYNFHVVKVATRDVIELCTT